ncbi:hypothetical protein [Coprococcus sp. AM11-30B]|jgi:hypothetical protein|uniref:hypothetical protein n=1 Tax=Coprococcus sp. AM11-30B TaxID=2997950 RepID=UPI0022E73C9C|nr:hypothetical protein [Coprococcus sp. AM11-30B]
MKNKLFLFFNKQAVIMEETQMVQMTGDRVKRVALETIESEIPDVDYGCDYEKDVALAFMHRVGGIVTLANRLAEECADG